nr:tetratricopeptide repeat protein [Deltaproteobacteria bacterium]
MIRPNDPFQRNRLGNLYRQAGRLEEAIVAHKRVIAIDPNLADGAFNLGLDYWPARTSPPPPRL